VPGFLQMWSLAFRQNNSILVSSDQRILFLMVWESSWRKLQAGCHVPFTEERLLSGHSTIKAWLVECCRGCWKVLQYPQRNSGDVSVTIGFLVTSLTKDLLPRILSLARRPALGRVLVVPFFYLRMMEATVFLGIFLVPFPRSVPQLQSYLRDLQTIPSTSWLGICSDMHCQLWDLK
jgi:hypothetical protein